MNVLKRMIAVTIVLLLAMAEPVGVVLAYEGVENVTDSVGNGVETAKDTSDVVFVNDQEKNNESKETEESLSDNNMEEAGIEDAEALANTEKDVVIDEYDTSISDDWKSDSNFTSDYSTDSSTLEAEIENDNSEYEEEVFQGNVIISDESLESVDEEFEALDDLVGSSSTPHIRSLCISGYPEGNNNSELMYDRIVCNALNGYDSREFATIYNYNSDKSASSGGSSKGIMDSKIRTAISGAASNDLFIFYYYGHSVSDGKGNTLGLSLNGNGKYCDEYYTWSNLVTALSAFPGKVFVIMDTCHAEDFWSIGVNSQSNLRSKFSCLLACGSDQTSKYSPKLVFNTPTTIIDQKSYGSFTYNLGKALGYWNGLVSTDDGNVSLNDIKNYCNDHLWAVDNMDVKSFSGFSAGCDRKLFHYNVGLNYQKLSLFVDDEKSISAYITGSKVKPQWSSSNKSVVTINTNGKIKALKPGTSTITATIKGSSAKCVITVTDYDISKATIKTVYDSYPITGRPRCPSPIVKMNGKTLTKDKDYTVSYQNNTNAGTGVIIVKGKGRFTGSKKANFKLTKRSMKDVSAKTKSPSYAYTGYARKPAPVVTLGTYTLVPDKDYSLAYKNNKNVGTASIIITGKGNFSGSKTITFKMVKASLEKAAVKTKSASYEFTGYPRKPVPVVKLGGKTLILDTDYSVTYKNNTNVGTATLTITGKGNYKGTAKTTFKLYATDLSKYLGKSLSVVKKAFPKGTYYTWDKRGNYARKYYVVGSVDGMEFDFDNKGNVNKIYIGLNIENKQNYCLMGAKIGMKMRTANDAIIKKGAELRRWSTSGYRVYKTNKGGCVYMDYWASEDKVTGLSLSSTYTWWF